MKIISKTKGNDLLPMAKDVSPEKDAPIKISYPHILTMATRSFIGENRIPCTPMGSSMGLVHL